MVIDMYSVSFQLILRPHVSHCSDFFVRFNKCYPDMSVPLWNRFAFHSHLLFVFRFYCLLLPQIPLESMVLHLYLYRYSYPDYYFFRYNWDVPICRYIFTISIWLNNFALQSVCILDILVVQVGFVMLSCCNSCILYFLSLTSCRFSWFILLFFGFLFPLQRHFPISKWWSESHSGVLYTLMSLMNISTLYQNEIYNRSQLLFWLCPGIFMDVFVIKVWISLRLNPF